MRTPLSIVELPKSDHESEMPMEAARLLVAELGSDRYRDDKTVLETCLRDLDGKIALAAMDGPDMIGVGTLKIADDGSGPVGRILQLAVLKAHAGNGVGRHIVEALEERAREEGAGSMRLQTLYDEAHPFYERLGYEAIGGGTVFTKPL